MKLPALNYWNMKRESVSKFVSFIFMFSYVLMAGRAGAELPVPMPNWNSYGEANLIQDAKNLTIDQISEKAILNWQSFNVGETNSVIFDQPSASSVALNRIYQQSPSSILGSIDANGIIYLVNPNGIIFGENSQVDVGSIIASTLDIDTELFTDQNFTRAINDGNPAFSKNDNFYTDQGLSNPSQSDDSDPSIEIRSGAQITADEGGRILIFAPSVVNNGSLESKDGQTILAASEDKVYLTISSNDEDLSGLLVEVDKGGVVTNGEQGSINVGLGNATLLGLSVNQNGLVEAQTSVNQNGTIMLLARDSAKVQTNTGAGFSEELGVSQPQDTTTPSLAIAENSGDLVLGANSRTVISTKIGEETLVDGQLQIVEVDTAVDPQDGLELPQSEIRMMGGTITFEENSAVVAKGGLVDVKATQTPNRLSDQKQVATESQIVMKEGAVIDVSGEDETVSVARNFVEVELRGNELRDSPLQRDGALRGSSVFVDIRKGTPLADASGAIANIQRTAKERNSDGGTVNLFSDGSVDIQTGSTIDLSGGIVTHETDRVTSSKLITASGGLVDISEADPNVEYSGVAGDVLVTYEKWLTEPEKRRSSGAFDSSYIEPTYLEGKSAGTLKINAGGISIDGDLKFDTHVGILQRDPSTAPELGTLELDLRGWVESNQDIIFSTQSEISELPSLELELDGDEEQEPSFNFEELVLIDESLEQSRVGNLEIKTNGDIEVEEEFDFELPKLGSISLTGEKISYSGKIKAAGGEVTFKTTADQSSQAITNLPIYIKEGSVIDVSGEWVNDFAKLDDGSFKQQGVIVKDGGKVKIDAKGDLDFLAGAKITADSGIHLSENGSVKSGRGGSIELKSEMEVIPIDEDNLPDDLEERRKFTNSRLTFAGDVSAYSMQKGGKLSLNAKGFTVQEAAPANIDPTDFSVYLTPEFFKSGGFSDFQLTSNLNSIEVTTDIALDTLHYWLPNELEYSQLPTGTLISDFASLAPLPEHELHPNQLILTLNQSAEALEDTRAGILIDTDASISLAPESELTIFSSDWIHIDGDIQNKGGTVDVWLLGKIRDRERYDQERENFTKLFFDDQALWIGANASIDVSGAEISKPLDAELGYSVGRVTDAGSINLFADNGYLIVASEETDSTNGSQIKSAQLNLSGVTANFNEWLFESGESGPIGHSVSSNAGQLNLSSGEGIIFEGDILADVQNPDATGLSLSVTIDRSGSTVSPANQFPNSIQDVVLSNSLEHDFLTTSMRFGQGIDTEFNGRAFINIALIEYLNSDLYAAGLSSFTEEANPELSSLIPSASLSSLSMNALNQSGASSGNLASDGRIVFDTDTSIIVEDNLVLNSRQLLIGENVDLVHLEAPLVTLGASSGSSDQQIAIASEPEAGFGTLSVVAQDESGNGHLDLLGNLTVHGVDTTSISSAGDIRFRGIFDPNLSDEQSSRGIYDGGLYLSGDLVLNADQVYGTTLVDYTVSSSEAVRTILDESENEIEEFFSSITISSPLDKELPTVLSAASSLSFDANDIYLSGNLKAPFGRVNLTATNEILLSDKATISVSGEDNLIPFGRVRGEDIDWIYSLRNPTNPSLDPVIIDGLRQKRIQLEAPNVQAEAGSQIDLSGRGDLFAYEFIPGPGGSQDVLDGSDLSGSFAILPGVQAGYAHFDPAESRTVDIPLGQLVYLEQNSELDAGWYTVLPPRYAMIPGAKLVTPQNEVKGITEQAGLTRVEGTPIVAGFYGDTFGRNKDSLASAFIVEPGEIANTRSEYQVHLASEFNTSSDSLWNSGPNAKDAGVLTADVTKSIKLESTFDTRHEEGRKGSVFELLADHLVIVENGVLPEEAEETAGDENGDAESGDSNQPVSIDRVILDSKSLNSLSVDRLILGAKSTDTDTGIKLAVESKTVEIIQGANAATTTLVRDDLIIAATDSILVDQNTEVKTDSTTVGTDQLDTQETIGIVGNGALLTVSENRKYTVDRSSSNTENGLLTVAEGGTVSSDYSVLLDASAPLQILGNVNAQGSLTLGAEKIALGTVVDDEAKKALVEANTLLLSSEFLTNRAPEELVLTSRSNFELYDGASFNGVNLELQGRGITARTDSDVTLSAPRILLANNTDSTLTDEELESPGAGSLTLDGSSVFIGVTDPDKISGEFKVSGFKNVRLNAAEKVEMNGSGTQFLVVNDISVDEKGEANLIVDTPLITAGKGANVQLYVNSAFTTLASTQAVPGEGDTSLQLGGKLAITAAQIDHGTNLHIPAGQVTMTSTIDDDGQSGIQLRAGSSVDVSATDVEIGGTTYSSGAGKIELVSQQAISLEASSLLDTSGGQGVVVIESIGGEIDLLGELRGGDAVDESKLSVKGANLDLQQVFDAVGTNAFGGQFSFTTTVGDIIVNPDQEIRSKTIELAADTGHIVVHGDLIADAESEASVLLAANRDLDLGPSAEVTARSTGAGQKGGKVLLSAHRGVVRTAANSLIDVSGGDGSEGGLVSFRMTRDYTSALDGSNLSGRVVGESNVYLEAFKTYENVSSVDTELLTQIHNDNQSFFNSGLGFLDSIGEVSERSSFELIPGVEISNPGDITIATEIDLASVNNSGQRQWRYGTDGKSPGVLNILAGGDLLVENNISDGFEDDPLRTRFYDLKDDVNPEDLWIVLEDRSWSFGLVAGADLNAANPLAISSNNKDASFVLNDGIHIRTGTGDISVASAGDIIFGGTDATIYTGGRSDRETVNFAGVDTYPDVGSLDVDEFLIIGPYSLGHVLFPDSGGDISLESGGDIIGSDSDQLFSDWLFRNSREASLLGLRDGNQPLDKVLTYWGINFTNFKQGVGALGGGNIQVSSAGDITNLSLSTPTTGKQIGDHQTNEVEVTGGGNISVEAGGDIISPRYLVDGGELSILGRGGLIPENENKPGLVLAVRDAVVDVNVVNDVVVDMASSISVIPQSVRATGDPRRVYPSSRALLGILRGWISALYFDFSGEESLNLVSTSGDLVFSNNTELVVATSSDDLFFNAAIPEADTLSLMSVFPGDLTSIAMDGDIRIENRNQSLWNFYPTEEGSIQLLAMNDIYTETEGFLVLNQSDADERLLGTYEDVLYDDLRKQGSGQSEPEALKVKFGAAVGALRFVDTKVNSIQYHRAQPHHANDNEPSKFIAEKGEIFAEAGSELVIASSEELTVSAGQDITNISFEIQHNDATDVSEIIAGGNFKHEIGIDDTGKIRVPDTQFVRVNGPGTLNIVAGGDLDLSAGQGIESLGDTINPSLADTGASISVLAGISGETNYQAIIDNYLTDIENSDLALIDSYKAHLAEGTAIIIDAGFSEALRISDDSQIADGISGGGAQAGTTIPSGNSVNIGQIDVPSERQVNAISGFEQLTIEQQFKLAFIDDYLRKEGLANESFLADLLSDAERSDFEPVIVDVAEEEYNRYIGVQQGHLMALMDYVWSDNFAGDMSAAATDLLGVSFNAVEDARLALSSLSIEERHQASFAAFNALEKRDQRFFLQNVVLNEIRIGGVEDSAGGLDATLIDGFERSEAIIDTLFPGDEWEGNIELSLSAIRSTDGGDIQFFVPGGNVDVGLAGDSISIGKDIAKRGKIVEDEGSISGFADGDINVNASRIIVLDGGDIMLYSSSGDIDAGKGAKTALSLPNLTFTIDPLTGTTIKDISKGIGGGGIQAACTSPGCDPGTVFLFAPKGIIDAGDAGITSEGNVVLAAQEIVGADNIDVGGVSVGIPTTSNVAAGLVGVSGLDSSATESAQSSATSGLESDEDDKSVAFLTVKITKVSNDLDDYGDIDDFEFEEFSSEELEAFDSPEIDAPETPEVETETPEI